MKLPAFVTQCKVCKARRQAGRQGGAEETLFWVPVPALLQADSGRGVSGVTLFGMLEDVVLKHYHLTPQVILDLIAELRDELDLSVNLGTAIPAHLTEEAYTRTPHDRENQNPEPRSKTSTLKKSAVTNSILESELHTTTVSKDGRAALHQGTVVKVKTAQSAQEQRSTVPPVTSCSPGVLSRRNLFEFWGAVVQQEQSSNNGRPSTKRQLSSESARTLRVVKKSTVKKEESGSVVQKEVYSEVSGLKSWEGEKGTVFTRTNPVKRKLRRDLFSDSKVFERVDSHVLRVSKQLKADRMYSLSRIVHCVTEEAQSELERVRAIWIWLCHNIEYDVTGYLGLSEKMCSPEQVIQAGKGVCCGYSRICLEMCREVGIKCMEVSGYGKGIGYRLGQSFQNKKSNHMWNVVQLGGQWCLLDSCWGAGTVDIESKTFTQRYDDFYFLADPEDFIDSHCPDDPQWQLMDSTVSLKQFEQRPFKTSEFYRLGLSIISPKEYPLHTVNGEAMVSIGCTKPVDFTYQISQLSEGAMKVLSSSFGLLTVSRQSMKLKLLPPASGAYDVMIFARSAHSEGSSLQNSGNFLLKCTGPTINLNELFPPALSASCGPGIKTQKLGISKPSHAAPIITTQQGKCNITFHNSQDLEFTAVLTKEHMKDTTHPLDRHVLFTYTDSKVTVSVCLPEAGIYKLGLHAKAASSEDFTHVCDYILKCTSEEGWQPFPTTYRAWKKGCVLFEPRSGLLEPLGRVRFRVRVPGAQKVCVVGESRTELHLNKSRVWEGEVSTGGAVLELKVAARFDTKSTGMDVILSFGILGHQNEF
ncbi:KY peptidase, partial [Polyodon spathula]|nr:KY peptidase [Polyodon spathula]